MNHRVQKLAAWGSKGAGPGQFTLPVGVLVDPAGFVYVADKGNWQVVKLGGCAVGRRRR